MMADSNRIVFPDEVAAAKSDAIDAAAAADKTSGGDSNSVENIEVPKDVSVTMRNMITVPSNCPPGYKMGADGVCREVFD